MGQLKSSPAVAQVNPTSCKVERSILSIPDGAINYHALTFSALARRESLFAEELIKQADSLKLSPEMQKDTRDLLTQLRKVSDPVLIGKMPEAELTSTSAAIWDLEKKVTRSYMNVVSDRVQKLSTELKTPEEREVINKYVDLTKTFSGKLQSGIEDVVYPANNSKWSNLYRINDYVMSRDANFIGTISNFSKLAAELAPNTGGQLANAVDVVNNSLQKEIAVSTKRLETVLKLAPGNTFTYVGAGDDKAYLNLAVSKVGKTGKVVAEDIDIRVVENLETDFGPSSNFSAILGTQVNPKLPAGTSDSVLVKMAFHEFTNPGKMLEGIWTALKPNGNLVIMEKVGFETENGPSAGQKAAHHYNATKLRLDLETAGFEVTQVSPLSAIGQLTHPGVTDYMVVARKCVADKK